jgi:MoaA/NifB/PqqE/SkfB family radical SAM enzyme
MSFYNEILLAELAVFTEDFEKLQEVLQEWKRRSFPKYLTAPTYVLWDITYKCNLRCIYCYNASPRFENELSDEELLDIADQIVRMKIFSVCLSGGEPFLRWKPCIELARYLADHGVSVTVITNGWYVTEKRANELAKYVPEVQVSIDGSRQEVHDKVRGEPGSFEKAVKAAKLFKKAGVKVNVATSLTRFNIEDFPNIITLCRELGVKSLRTQHLSITGRAFLNDVKPTRDQYRRLERFIEEYRQNRSKMESQHVMYGDSTLDIKVGGRVGFTMGIGITADGFLTVSPHLPFEMGNLREKTLDEAWREGLRVAWKHPKLRKIALKIRDVDDVPIATAGHVYGVSGLIHLNPGEIIEARQEH